tara:strand:- start:1653 stop:3539 length:1887 start_codon:yes stop_codon:yes gene_type:complete
MCGIAGILYQDGQPAEPRVVRQMTDLIAHRGPDGEGTYCSGPMGLGHRRLAIIDLSSAGHQPMQTKDGRFTIVYNGEVYNFNELRSELEAAGWVFRSNTDTEVVLNALAHWGPEAIRRFNGMFAFALWDEKEQKLLLARDRYGVKPLYFTKVGNKILFASEIKSFLAEPAFQVKVNKDSLLEYLTFQNFFTSQTLYDNVRLIPAATYITVTLGVEQGLSEKRYWDFDFSSKGEEKSHGEHVEELDFLIRQAVNRQLVGDVPVGAYLSGGMDSGAITAIASPQIEDMHTFTVGYDSYSAGGLELAMDERPQAELMSYLFKTRHYEMVLKAGDMERCMQQLVWHMEEPRVGQSYPNYYAAHLASKFSKVVLAGTGGDELFGGYPWRYYKAVNNENFDDYVEKYYSYWQRILTNAEISKVFPGMSKAHAREHTLGKFKDVFSSHANELTSPEDYVNHSLYLEAKTFLHGLLVMEDKLSMAHGLETRVPFLDNDLVDFAQKLPVRFKLGNLKEVVQMNENDPVKGAKYFNKTKDGKLLLREAVGKFIPSEVSKGVKRGFSAPDEAWFKGDSIEYVREKLLNKNASIYNWMDYREVEKILGEHLKGKNNRRLLIWSLLYLEEWCDCFMKARLQ